MTRTLVTIFAHPDDETFGVGGSMAQAIDAGWHVASICATRGEVGEIADPSLATPETLGEVRERELRAACAALGVMDVRFLGYRDSGMEGTPENEDPRAFANADEMDVADRLLVHLDELRPSVVVTFEPGGVYGHPDHRKISRCASAAYDRAPGARLYYSGPSREAFAELRRELEAAGVAPSPLWERVGEFGVPAERITTLVDVTPQLARKKRALAAHASQMSPWLRSLPERLMDRLLSRESFELVRGDLTEQARASLIAGL